MTVAVVGCISNDHTIAIYCEAEISKCEGINVATKIKKKTVFRTRVFDVATVFGRENTVISLCI
jgi:hypothetical protein